MLPTLPRPGPRALGRGGLLDQLAAETAPVVVLYGPPGVGKSTVAGALAAASTGAVCWVEARGCTTAAELDRRIAAAQGPPAGTQSAATGLDRLSENTDLLAVLDHCDGLSAPVGRLPQRPGLRWVLTRRGPLPGAAAVPVPPLDLAGARKLWRSLCRQLPPDAQLARLVELCDGLPLALALAARRQRMLGTRALIARLEHSTAVLGEGLAAAVRESLAGLSPTARAALAQLGCGPPLVPVEAVPEVFSGLGSAGDPGAPAAKRATGDRAPEGRELSPADLGAPFDLLDQLHEAGLLDPAAPEGCVRVLRSAVAPLGAPTPEQQARWSRWCAAAAQRLARGQDTDYPRAVSEALAWHADQATPRSPLERLDLALALRQRTGGSLLRRLVDALPLSAVPPERQRELLRCKLHALELSGQPAAACEVLEQAGELAETPELTGTLAYAIDRAGDPGGALAFLHEAVARLEPEAAQDPRLHTILAHVATYAAWLQWWWQGDTAGAVALLERVLAARPALAPPPLKALQGLAAMRIHSGQHAAGRAALKDVQDKLYAQGIRPLHLSGVLVEAELLWHGWADPEAATLGEHALELALQLDSVAGECSARLLLAQIAAHQRRSAAALAHLEAALLQVQGTGLDFTHCELWFELAVLQADRGQADRSEAACARAVELCTRGVDRYGVKALEHIVRGHQALAAAERAADPGPPLDTLAEVVAMARPPRVAALIWGRAQRRLQAQAQLRAPPREAPQQLTIGADFGWFRTAGSPACDLRRSRVNRAMLAALVEAEGPVDSGALAARVWPGQRLLERSARHRVHVALSALRKGGLAPFLVREDAGYGLRVPGGIVRDPAAAPPAA